MSKTTAILLLNESALPTARLIKDGIEGAVIHGLEGRVRTADVFFRDSGRHLQDLFAQGAPIVGLCASGILIRALAPVLRDKHQEPPVIACSSDGRSIVPLLGGHHGANALACTIAGLTGGQVAITTASDAGFGVTLDEPPAGWKIANPEKIKPVAAALLSGQSVALLLETDDGGWLSQSGTSFAENAAEKINARICVSDREPAGDPEALLYRPPTLALGVGGERGVALDELRTLAADTAREAGFSLQSVACVVSLDLKADEEAVLRLADELGVPARFFTPAELEAEKDRLATPSQKVFAETGCHGVAEGAALAAVGAKGVLVAAKKKSPRATCALARAQAPLNGSTIGAARGRLSIIGIGPGNPGWLTHQARAHLAQAEEIVGYGLYLDLIDAFPGNLLQGKTRHTRALGEEEARVRLALERAAAGRHVALVSSGDAGIYGMAALVFELLERENNPAWNRIDVETCPGLSALQAAAARAGAPLGHDFCAISLSDLLTPEPVILRRLEAAAAGDFVVALYNPVSRERRHLLARARDILLSHRERETPVILARNLGRDEESILVKPLGELETDDADMLTLVLIGSAATRTLTRGTRRWTYTPRGYAEKNAAPSVRTAKRK